MADMDQNLSLADALTEPPPQIEEEVKRDFMASLEAEKFDDMIGEKVGKTDYVPLLDDDEPKAGSQEAKAKPRAENVPRECPSATGPAAVVENGDHDLEGSRQEPSGKIMEEQMPYKEFLGHNDTWKVDDGSRGFESQLGFKPMDVAGTFPMPREDVSDLLLLPEDMMGFGQYFGALKESHGPYGTAEFSEPPSLGFIHPPAAGFEPLSFLGPALNQSQAEAQQVPVGVEKPHHGGDMMVFPGELSPPEAEQMMASSAHPAFGGAMPTMEEQMGFEPSLDPGLLPPKTLQAGFLETPGSKDLKSEDEDVIILAADSCPMLEKPEAGSQFLPAPKEKELSQHPEDPTAIHLPTQKAEEMQASHPFHPREEDSPFPDFKTEDLEGSSAQHVEKIDQSKLALAQQIQEMTSQLSPGLRADGPPLSPGWKADKPPLSPGWKADGLPPSPGQKADRPPFSPVQKADGPPLSPVQKADGPPLSPGQKAEGPPPSPVWKADTPPLSPTQPSEKVEETKASLSPVLANPEMKSPPLPSQPVETLPGQEHLDEKKKQPLGTSMEQLKEPNWPTPTEPGEHLPDHEDSMGSVLGEKPHMESPRSFLDESTLAQPMELSAGKLPLEQEEEVKAPAEVPSVEDTAALPSKALPPSPEKKTKPLASAGAKPAAVKAKPRTVGTLPAKRPASATVGPSKKATSAAETTFKRPSTGVDQRSSLISREVKPKVTDVKSPEKKVPLSKPSAKTTLAAARLPSPRTPASLPPKKPSSAKTEVRAAEVKKMPPKTPLATLSRPKSAPVLTTASPALLGTPASRPKVKPVASKFPGIPGVTAEAKKPSLASKALPKTSLGSKSPRPSTSISVPDLKNIRSKIGSTDNIKYQPGGGKAKIENKSAVAARNSEPNGVSKTTPNKSTLSKEGLAKSLNGKVQIISKKANYSHVQSKCGSKDNIKHVPGGGNVQNVPKPASGNKSQPSTNPKPNPGCTNVQIQNKKIDLSKVSSKCGSKTNIKHKPGGGDVKIENQKLNFKEKAQAKVGSLENVGHVPAGGTVKTEGDKQAAPENGAPPSGTSAPQENGAGPLAPSQGNGDQSEIQCFDTQIQETN